MNTSLNLGRSAVRKADPRDSDLDPRQVVPFGVYGAGLITAHPVGLVVVLGMLFMALAALPEARLFFLAAIPAGVVCGLLLWFRHR